MWPTTTGPTAFVSVFRFYFAFLHPRSCSHVSSQPTTHSTHRKRRHAVKTVNTSSCITPVIVQLCCWLYSHFCTVCYIYWYAYFLSPFEDCYGKWAFQRTPWAFCCIVLSQSLMAGQEMCWWNASIMSLSSVCAPNTVVCWELLGYWPKNKIYTVLILSLQHSILLIVQIQIKNCAKSSLLMKCSQKTTWLPYTTVNAEHLRSLYTLAWLTEQCAQ